MFHDLEHAFKNVKSERDKTELKVIENLSGNGNEKSLLRCAQ